MPGSKKRNVVLSI